MSDLLVSGDASVDGGVNDSVQRHAEQVDVAVQLLVLVLADQSPQLLVLILHHRDGVFQRTHLHLTERKRRVTLILSLCKETTPLHYPQVTIQTVSVKGGTCARFHEL